MQPRLILLPGWGLGEAALQPLAAALNAAGLATAIAALPALTHADASSWLEELDARLPDDVWLGGWSLGGMLATALAARRGSRCAGLVTLASNACFVARSDWPEAMPITTFDTFRQQFAEDAATTRRRFSMLCAQGSPDARRVGRQLQQGIPADASEIMDLAGLDVLAALDNRAALRAFSGPQTHFFAAEDALVPASVLAVWPVAGAALCAGSHAFPLEYPFEIAEKIAARITEVTHG